MDAPSHPRIDDHVGPSSLDYNGKYTNGVGFSLGVLTLLSRATPTTVNHSFVEVGVELLAERFLMRPVAVLRMLA